MARRRRDDRSHTRLAIGIASSVCGLVVWELVARLFFTSYSFPPVTEVVMKAVRLGGELLDHIQASYLRILSGFVLGSGIGAILGIGMGTLPWVRRLLEPVVNFFRFIPAVAWLGPVLIWFGIGETSKITLITYTTAFIVLLNTYIGTNAVRQNWIRAARCLGATRGQVVRYVLLPQTVRYILVGMSLGLANSFATIVTAEMLGADAGLGYLILVSRNFMATDAIFVGILTLGALGLLTSRTFDYLMRRIARRYFV